MTRRSRPETVWARLQAGKEKKTMAAKARMYNAGDKISEMVGYSLPDGHDIHCKANYLVEAPAGGFFEVPTEMQLGLATIRVEFYRDLLTRFGDRGMVLIDANLKADEIGDNEPLAANDKQAIERGQARWREFLEMVVRRHLEQSESIRASGGAPLAARGFAKRALKLLNLEDPADQLTRMHAVQPSDGGGDADLRKQVETLQQQVALLTGSGDGKGQAARK